jgi:hypothetical protein
VTVPATDRRAGPFLGTGSIVGLPFTFKVFSQADVVVTRLDTVGVESTLAIGTDYTVSLNADQDTNPGGTVTPTVAPAVGETTTLTSGVSEEQPLDLLSGGSFRPQNIEDALDRATILIQQIREELNRTLRLPVSSSGDALLPAGEANKFLGWDEAGAAIVNRDAADLASVVVAGTAYTDIFDGTGAQTIFVLTADPGSVNALDIFIGGVKQVNGVDFNVSGTTLTFIAAPPPGTGNVAVRYVAAIPAVGGASALDTTFTQQGSGAVTRSVAAKLYEFVSVTDFGADPTGVADSTAAIQAALNTSARHVHFPSGAYRVTDSVSPGATPALVSNQAGRLITCDGYITATTPIFRLFGIYGANSTVTIHIEGNNQIGDGVLAYADGCVIENCRINDLYADGWSCIATGNVTGVNGGTIVRNNIIKGVNSVTDGVLGNGVGSARAVRLSLNDDATGENIIEGNYIEDCLGEEGDAIAVIALNGSTYKDGRCVIRNNTIKNFTRRAIKIQCNRTRIEGNYITHDFAASGDVPNATTIIDLVQGGDHYVKDNVLDACKFFVQVSVFATGAEVWNNIFVEDNKFLGLGSETSGSTVTIQSQGSNVIVRGNYFTSGIGRSVSCGSITGLVIENNTFNVADESSTRVISVASTVSKALVRGNILLSGEKQCFIGDDAANTVVTDNHVKSNTPLYRGTIADRNALITDNSMDGTAGFISGSVPAGVRFGGNWNFGNQANNYPGDLAIAGASPATSLAGLYVRTGQRVYDVTPTAGNYIGWVAMADGLADVISWKQFGAILP